MTTDGGTHTRGPHTLAEANSPPMPTRWSLKPSKRQLLFGNDANAEKLHRLRVALRRLRTLLWAYRPMLDAKFDNEQRELFKSLASAAGNTRDWDILIALVENDGDETLLSAFRKTGMKRPRKAPRR
ncbi:CHAD domain-containing protein [Paraburkholderia fynbosensis]|uniref:CHAD domain-containing protein n=1 Tax=Paraburkholderia fynbosensis TaxID=1200993 RepID=A0A6J5H088_9BURK|nr:CHAD domain-containing protein [Paraburkholderia fynbosensis]CAB3809004.1 hypothetical protein LMG27177_06675 [Paraburkholderia fynbosensis]